MNGQLAHLLASLEAAKVRVAGMEAENAHSVACGNGIKYGEDAFFAEARHMEILANAMREW